MKRGQVLILMLFLCPIGCTWIPYAVRNTVAAPVNEISECIFRHRLRQIAHDTWKAMQREDSTPHSQAYVKGFEDGFVAFVDSNGTGEPPAIPPACYQRDVLRSPNGQDEIEDWYSGYRLGARAARESGLREHVIIPISLPPKLPTDPTGIEMVPGRPNEDTIPLRFMPTPLVPEEK